MFSKEYLKSSQGDPRWLRFFALMGSAIALRENAPPVPETPTSRVPLLTELKDIAQQLNARKRLLAYGEALSLVEPKDGSFFLMRLNASEGRLEVIGFKRTEHRLAQAKYMSLERDLVGKPDEDAVLVSVDSVKNLRSAYPNYYLDTKRFVKAFDQAVS